MVFIELITGKAGCGKSFMLSKYIKIAAAKTNKWVVLAYTHSAIKNIEQYVVNNYKDIDTTNHFMTIHKYFHINYYNKDINIINRGWEHLDYMFIDEFTLISIYLFTSIWPMIKSYVGKLILCGDYRQLKPVNSSDKIYYDNLKRYLALVNINVNNVGAIQHFDNIILSLDVVKNNVKKVVNLTKQYRADSNINKLIESLCFANASLASTNEDTKPHEQSELAISKYMVKLSSVVNLVENNNYVFIASTYKQLRKINKLISKQDGVDIPILTTSSENENDNIEMLTIKANEVVRITETYDDFQNGELYIIVDIYDNCLIVKNTLTNELKQLFPIKCKQDDYYPVLPSYLLTFHKSQGLTINNVIISLDNIFDFAMLYTGISRSRNNILFYTDKQTIDYSIFDNIKTNYTTLDTLFNKLYINTNT